MVTDYCQMDTIADLLFRHYIKMSNVLLELSDFFSLIQSIMRTAESSRASYLCQSSVNCYCLLILNKSLYVHIFFNCQTPCLLRPWKHACEDVLLFWNLTPVSNIGTYVIVHREQMVLPLSVRHTNKGVYINSVSTQENMLVWIGSDEPFVLESSE